MFCTHCGKEVVNDGKYCSYCGILVRSQPSPNLSSNTPSIGFREFLKKKEENRRSYFQPSSKKAKKSVSKEVNSKQKSENEVSINIGIKKYVIGNSMLKIARGRTLPIRVLPSVGADDILTKAVTKHENHNSSLMKGQRHVLLYPDDTEVINLPGTDKPFVLKEYRDEIGRSYSRITLYIALHSDFVFTGMDNDTSSISESGSEGEETKSKSDGDGKELDLDLLKPVFASSRETCSDGTHGTTSTCTHTSSSTCTSTCTSTTASAHEVIDLVNRGEEKEECVKQSLVECPTCFKSFPLNEIGSHADDCADIWIGDLGFDMQSSSSDDEPETSSEKPSSEEAAAADNATITSIISDLASKNLTSVQVKLNIRRKNLWSDFKDARRKHKLTPNNRIRVVFMGEPAVDGGGPKREFFTEILDHIERKLFMSGRPVYSTVSLMNEEFKLAGELMVMSIIQGGPAPNFLCSSVYAHLVQKPLSSEDLEGPAKLFTTKLSGASSDEELQNILLSNEGIDMLEDIGYKGVPHKETLASVDFIIQSICIKNLLSPFMAPLMQLTEGLTFCDVLLSARKYPNLWKPVFTQGLGGAPMSAVEFLDQLRVNFSLSQIRKEAEINVYKYFCDFIDDLSNGFNDFGVSIPSLLKWLTGSSQVPPLGFPKKFTLEFVHGCQDTCRCRPTVSTCDILLKLPVHIKDAKEMSDLMSSAVNESHGFGVI